MPYLSIIEYYEFFNMNWEIILAFVKVIPYWNYKQ